MNSRRLIIEQTEMEPGRSSTESKSNAPTMKANGHLSCNKNTRITSLGAKGANKCDLKCGVFILE